MATVETSYEERLRQERALTARWIEPHPSKRGYAESVVVDNGTSVWVIINAWLASDGDSVQVKHLFRLSEEALRAALAYYRHHKHVIDARLALEEDEWSNGRNDQGQEQAAAAAKSEQELIARWIAPDPQQRGRAEACVIQGWVPVWALIGYLPAVDGDIAAVARDYDLPREAVEAALAYYRENRDAIDARLLLNDEAAEG